MFSCIITFPILWTAQFTHICVTHGDEDTWVTISMKEEWLVTHKSWYTRVAVREKWHFFSLAMKDSKLQISGLLMSCNANILIDLAFALNPHDRQVIINIFTFKWLSLCLNTQTCNWIDPAIYQRGVWWWNSSLIMNLSGLYIWGNNTNEFSLMKKLDTLHNLMI